jgi:hypothetical protein
VARGAVLALAAFAGAVLASGCGSAGSSVSEKQAAAYATSINLRAGDVPGFFMRRPGRQVVTKPHQGPPCTGHLDGGDDIYSPVFVNTRNESASSPMLTVQSRIEVEQPVSTGPYSPSIKKLQRILRCASARSPIGSDAKGKPTKTYSVLPLPPRLRGAPVYGFRTRDCGTLFERCRPGHNEGIIDTFGIIMGPVLTGLLVTSENKPFPPATEQRLLSLLYSRAKAHRLT